MSRFAKLPLLLLGAVAILSTSLGLAQTIHTPPSVTATPTSATPPPHKVDSIQDTSNTSSGAWVSDGWANVVISAINLIFVIFAFAWSYCDRRTLSNRESRVFWIQELVLVPNRDLMSNFFAQWSSTLAELANTSIAPEIAENEITRRKHLFVQFKTSARTLRYEIVEPLCVLDKNFHELNILLNTMQDVVATALQNMPIINTENTSSGENGISATEFQNLKNRFISTLVTTQASATSV